MSHYPIDRSTSTQSELGERLATVSTRTHVIRDIDPGGPHGCDGDGLASEHGGHQRRPVLVGDPVAQFLVTPRCNESPHTHRAYTGARHRVADLVGTNRPLAAVDDAEIATAVTTLWGSSAPTIFNRNRNRNRAAVASWAAWCTTKAKWTAPTLPPTCERRKEPADETESVEQPVIDRICTHRDISLRERLLWRMLYETASRATAVLELNVEDCDFDNRRATVTVKGSATVWGRGTTLLLPRYLRGAGPWRWCYPRRTTAAARPRHTTPQSSMS
jgi:integrase